MAKEQEQEQEQQAQQPAAEAAAAVSGASASEVTTPVILRAKSREELDTQFAELKAKQDGHTLTAGAVAYNHDDGVYILRIDIY
ncbi:MAG: hypothetical protein IJ066_10860 [Bacteroidaceae bacterium]|nr:hypothetical protein [Bacteroidaceae bacterium]